MHGTLDWTLPEDAAAISTDVNGSPLRVRISNRVAGAIDSITWRGFEFINAYDHGRELQSALRFDGHGECANPTEAGSSSDENGNHSSSQLIKLDVWPQKLATVTQMAPWATPLTRADCPALSAPNISAQISKTVELNAGRLNVISFELRFDLPTRHDAVTFEVLTAYLNPSLDRFWTYDPQSETIKRLVNWKGEQGFPIIVSTDDNKFAISLLSLSLPSAIHLDAPTYGSFDFANFRPQAAATTKINVVTRSAALSPATYAFRCLAVIGTLEEVKATLDQIKNSILYCRQ